MPLIAIIFGMMFVSGVAGVGAAYLLGYGHEKLFSNFVALRVHLETKGIKASGSMTNGGLTDHISLGPEYGETGLRAQAFFTIKSGGAERSFYVDDHWTEARANEKLQRFLTNHTVPPQNIERNGVMLLYLENSWGPEDDALAKKLIEAFRTFSVPPRAEVSL